MTKIMMIMIVMMIIIILIMMSLMVIVFAALVVAAIGVYAATEMEIAMMAKLLFYGGYIDLYYIGHF